jgi:hypothetical protein
MNYQRKRPRVIPLLVLGLCLAVTSANADSPNAAGITRVLSKAKVLTQSFTVQSAGSHCIVVTYRNPKASGNDMKIDAILTAKAIRDVYPSIQSVTVQFYETYNLKKYQYIDVHAGDVSAFSLGGLNKDQLLNSLSVNSPTGSGIVTVSRQIVDNYQVVPGFNKSGRLHMLANLQEIQTNGGDLSQLWPRFMEVEKIIKDGGAEGITNDYNRLVPDVAQALQRAQLETSRIADQSRLRNNQLESQGAVGALARHLHAGSYGYPRRMRIANEIDRLAIMGQNVQYYQSLLFNTIEPLCNKNEQLKAAEQMSQLERLMGLSPYTGP